MKYPGENKSARTGIRVSLPLLILVLVIVASVLIIYSTPVLTIEKRTSGNLTFIDGAGDLVSGTIEISMIGAPPGRKSNVNSITWRNAPNAWIYFDAYEKENISINLRISGDSPNGRVSLEDHGAAMPGSVGVPVPGVPVKYVELHSTGVSFADADISIYYTDAELKGLDETSLVIYSYDGGAWTELPTRVDAAKNVVSAAVVTLSVFAVSTRASERIEIRDTRGMPVTSEVKTYDEAKQLRKSEKASIMSSEEIPDMGELEVNAIESKNVSVKLKLNRQAKGEIIFDDFGKNNPVSTSPLGKVIKYVEIGAHNISYSSAEIAIKYRDEEINGADERKLSIAHYKSGGWYKEVTSVDAENNTVTATVTSLSSFAVIESTTSYNATLYIYDTKSNTNPADDELVNTSSLTNLPANGTTFNLGNVGNIYRNRTYVVEMQIRTNNTYEFDADYMKETFFKAGVPFNITNASGREYLINTSLVPKDGNRTEDIFVHTNSNTDYSSDAQAYEVGVIRGDLDIVSASRDNNVRWHRNNNGSWTTATVDTTNRPHSVALGDIDNDGDLDIVFGDENQDVILNKNNNGTWSPVTIDSAAGGIVYSVALGDINNDGDLDVVYGTDTGNDVYFRENTNGDGSAWGTRQTVSSTATDIIYSVAIGDIDNDGDLDVVSASRDNNVRWHRNNNGLGTSWTTATVDTTNRPHTVALGDIDNDGDLDIVFGDENQDVILNKNNSGTWSPVTIDSAAGGIVYGVALGDINNDGDLDVVYGTDTGNNVYFRENTNGDGSAWGTRQTVSSTPTDIVYSVAVGDIDNDGDLDVVSASRDLSVRWHSNNNGLGTSWSTTTVATLGDEAYDAAVGDIDNDANSNILDYHYNSTESAEKGVDSAEFTGWDNLTANTDYSFYFIVTPDNEWGVNGSNDNVTFYAGNEAGNWSSLTEPKIYGAIRTPIKVKWMWTVGAVPPPTYTLSGYVLNGTGSPLSGATVETNTSLSTTTNASGFYNFTGLSNGTYLITASLTGYNTNSTTKTISGGDVTNANISLSTAGVYRWIPDTGTTVATGVTTDWGTCGTNPSATSSITTLLTNNITSNCSSGYLFSTATDPLVELFFNTSYTRATNVSGNWYYGRITSGSTYTFRLIYVYPNGTKVALSGTGSVVSSADQDYNVSLTGINGIIPKGAKLGLRISRSGISGYPYFGDTANKAGTGPSGYFSVTEIPLPIYNVSGYVTNISSGLPLSGATVQTNTSESTTTNASGFYNFTGLINGTYMINASLAGYFTNSITVAISGADNTTANISLTPLSYLLSGYVTNASTGVAISGANVTTNTSLNTTTNATGYYNFTLSNGTYIITASKANYSDNSTTQTINGANVTNVNITLAGVTVETGKILVATDRFVILDDDFTGTPESGFASPAFGSGSGDPSGGNDAAKGKATTIGAYALYIDSNGFPVPGKTIRFTFSRPAAYGVFQTINATTDANGTARAFSNIDDTRYWGRWKLKAENSTFSANTTFIYNWWGCNYNDGGCDKDHSGKDWSTGAAINSPYMDGYDKVVNDKGDHQVSGVCTGCHRSYDGTNGTANNDYPSTASTIKVGIHSGIRCDNASCHGSINNHMTNIDIHSCYGGAGCHAFRTDIAGRTTLNGIVSNYSNSTGIYNKYHTPNSTVLCIICHGPVHNTTKPDNSTRRNNNTESEQCTTCHTSYNKHNASVNCTLCHSDDVHAIKVFAQNATYINLTRSNPNPNRGNCTNCHQNSSFYAALKAQPNATNQSGRNPPVVASPVKHSNDSSAGAKWKQTYWTNSQQLTWCIYCHSNTTHSAVALGRPANWDGNNIVNSSLTSNTTWCSGCHWQGYANGSNTYGDMVNAFTGAGLLVPPEISGNATYGANTSIYEYTNHSLYTRYYPNLNDSACNRCHGYNYGFTTITQLVHNQSRVGGANCVDCHDTGGIALVARVNVTATNDNNEIHKSLNSGASVSNGTAYYANNKRCWACHANASEPTEPNAHYSNSTFNYKTPYSCENCHIKQYAHNTQLTLGAKCTVCHYTILNISQHFRNGTSIRTPAAASCYACHNKSEMLIPAYDPDNGSGAVYGGLNGGNNSASHYGKKRADLRIGISTNCSYCHQNTSTVFVTAMLDPSYNSSISNHSLRYNNSNPDCTSSQCHNTGWIHNSTLTKPSLTLPNSTYCTNCHGSSGGATINNLTKHNNSVDCSSCHLYTARDIHPAKYLQPNSSYNTSNSTAVNCINCHQTGLAGFLNAPMVPNPMHHSDNASNGTLWNSTPYWISPLTSCIYCHNDTKHNATALGRPANWKGNNIVNSSLSTGTWCASCHYRNYSSGGKNYSDMTGAFTSVNLPVPPEITNGSYAVNIYNHSNYYNHSLKDYSDAVCVLCHGANLSSTSRISAFLHNISWGSCTSCHYSFEAMNNTTRPDRYVDQGMYNTSLHRSLSCQNCHTQGHRNIGARKACEDCHAVQANPITDKDRHNITSTPSTYYYNSVNVVNITDCTTCHSGTLYNTSIATYGYGKSKDCDYCHTYPDKYYE